MKWKNRITNYNFWISIVSATLLILQAFNIKLDIANINEIVTALLGLLVVIGIINDPTKSSKDAENNAKNTNKNEPSNKQIEPNKAENKTEKEAEKEAEIDEKMLESEQQNEKKQIENKDLNIVENEHDAMPIDKQNENDFDLAENNLQILIDKISQDFELKYTELNKAVEILNIKTQQNIENNQTENCEVAEKQNDENFAKEPENASVEQENNQQTELDDNTLNNTQDFAKQNEQDVMPLGFID